jgi:hypothetical protein
MKTFAYVNPETHIVENISIGDDDWSDENWIEYSSSNVAGIGYSYRSDVNVFIAPQPYPSWILDLNFKWQPPVAMPTDGIYSWDEATQAWVEVNGN